MKIKQVDTFTVRIYVSGPIEIAKQYLRGECRRQGLCVTIEPTTFIYTGGEEVGYVVGLLNYPKFPTTPEQLDDRAVDICRGLLDATFQDSALMVTPMRTLHFTRRSA